MFTMIFFLLLISISLLHFSICELCDSENCAGPYTLQLRPLPEVDLWWDQSLGHITVYPEKVEVTIGYRSRKYQYCYDGGPGDKNTGCEIHSSGMKPNDRELADWSSRQQCQIGKVSCPGNDLYWGSGADLCWENKAEDWVNEAEFSCAKMDWFLFARHTCTYDWRCGVKNTKMPLDVKIDSSGKGIALTFDNNGKTIILNEGNTYVDIDFETSMLIKMGTPKIYPQILHCIGGEDRPTLCQMPNMPEKYGGMSGSVIEISGKTGVGRNIRLDLILQKNLKAVPHEHKTTSSWLMSKIDTSAAMKSATSLEDLKPVIHTIMYNQDQASYNFMKMMTAMQETRSVLLEVIRSSGKIDDELIGNLLGQHSKSKWFNKNLFHLCSCFQTEIEAGENCNENYFWKDGRILDKKDSEKEPKCISYSPNSIKKIELFNITELLYVALAVPVPQGAASSWEGWSWLASKKEQMMNSMEFTNNVQNSENNGISFISKMKDGIFQNWWSFFLTSSFLTYITFFMAFYAAFLKK